MAKKVLSMGTGNFATCLSLLAPEKNSGTLLIPEENSKIFRHSVDTRKNFWYYINTGRKFKNLPVF